VFAYQGLVPKLWKLDRGDVAIWQDRGQGEARAKLVVRAVGAVEAGFAVAMVVRSRDRWPFTVALAAMPALAIGTAKADLSILSHAFNPGSLGVAVAALAGVALITREGRPSGRRPLRQAPDHPPTAEEPP
jgi:hypothetical protein